MSTVDWPGKLAAALFLQGCPWQCPYCHNFDLIPMKVPGTVPWEKVRDLLSRRRGLLDGVVFSGGEATRQLALVPAMQEVREQGFLVGLHTAGAFPNRLRELLAAKLVHWVGIDIKATPANYPQVAGRANAGTKAWESLEIVLQAPVAHEVRLTVFPDGPRDALAVAQYCRNLGVETFALQRARATGAPAGFQEDGPGWEAQVKQWAEEIGQLGFPQFILRAD